MKPRALTIAGTDPTGGAGMARDLATFAAFGVRGAVAVTAVTVQDGGGVQGWNPIPPEMVRAQIEAARGAGIDALKTGMLADPAIIDAVAGALQERDRVVVDPVLVATSGGSLADPGVAEALVRRLIPQAWVVTPNAPEAAALTGMTVTDADDAVKAGAALLEAGARAVLVTGGHLDGDLVVDVLVTARGVRRFDSPRVRDTDTHGTGCAVSAGICAGLALGLGTEDACARAIAHVGAWLGAGGWRSA